jgi:hypothetical protein
MSTAGVGKAQNYSVLKAISMKRKVVPCLIKHHARKMYGGSEALLLEFLTLAPD